MDNKAILPTIGCCKCYVIYGRLKTKYKKIGDIMSVTEHEKQTSIES